MIFIFIFINNIQFYVFIFIGFSINYSSFLNYLFDLIKLTNLIKIMIFIFIFIDFFIFNNILFHLLIFLSFSINYFSYLNYLFDVSKLTNLIFLDFFINLFIEFIVFPLYQLLFFLKLFLSTLFQLLNNIVNLKIGWLVYLHVISMQTALHMR